MFDGIRKYYELLIPALTELLWQELEKRLVIERYPKGSLICREGDICKGVYFIQEGLARLYYTVEGREICTGFAKEGEYLSEYDSFLTQSPAAQSMDVLEDTIAINLPFEQMQTLYEHAPVYEQAGRKIAENLFVLISRYNTRLLTLSPEDRYQYIIENQYHLIQRVPQYMLASLIGISPEHLSRIRKKMTR
ncbi:Crp/Fnr family transcriptional regulator [Flavihumibacter sp. UBA7668]|uniref:Crp/Fnr family transcriptional regulator n=1 Tax=Flavihumibacter sp. UBA7668 TaxID=1946542 RepID=UPI0025BAF426|nr:Crp/Fnr family transcriptional regulator [Flavihumibacter sp. UBA7668]